MSEHDSAAPIPQRPTDDPMPYPHGGAEPQHPTGPETPAAPTPQRPAGPYLPSMIAGLVLIITGALVAAYRLADVDSGVPSIPWVIVVLGVVLIVAGVLGALTNRRHH